MYRICFFCLFCASLFGAEHVYLTTPNLSSQEMIGTNVGIRPCRRSGVRIEAEWLQNKLIIHNYGYGGSGLTLSFGGSQEVLKILGEENPSSQKVAVLGAGVVGLAVAFDLLEQGYEVHLYSDKWSPDLTSNVAAGIWTPLLFPSDLPLEKKQFHQRLLEASEQRFLNSTHDAPEFLGVRLISAYSFRAGSPQEANTTHLSGEEIIAHFDNGTIKYGRRFHKLGLDGKVLIEDLFAKIKDKGALLEQRYFESLDDVLALNEPVIINCTSIGSSKLFNDQDFIPVRGQIVYFQPQRGIDYSLGQNIPDSPNMWVSIYPWSDRIILGGIYEQGESDPITNPEIIYKLIQNAKECLSQDLLPLQTTSLE